MATQRSEPHYSLPNVPSKNHPPSTLLSPPKPPAKYTTSSLKPTRQVHYIRNQIVSVYPSLYPLCRRRPRPHRNTHLPVRHPLRLPPRSPPRSPAKPPADGADRNAACGRQSVASVRGPHSRSFAREPPHPHLTGHLVPRRSRLDVCGGSRAPYRSCSCGPAHRPATPGLTAERVHCRPTGRLISYTDATHRLHAAPTRHRARPRLSAHLSSELATKRLPLLRRQ